MSQRIKDALEIAMRYGGTDGEHHKMWVIDQMVRALTGAQAKTTSQEYRDWVDERCDGEDGPDTYSWDEGIPP